MLSLRSLPWRSLRHHARGNLAVTLAAAVSAAVLTGALFVGDSLRGSLRARAERQLNGVTAAWTGSRLIRSSFITDRTTPALMLQGSLSHESIDGPIILPRVVVIGLTDDGFQRFNIAKPTGDGIPLVASVAIAERLGMCVGAKVRLSVQQFSSVPRSSILGNRSADASAAGFSATIVTTLTLDHPANDFNLLPNPSSLLNVFVPLERLQDAVLINTDDRRALRKPELIAERTRRVNALFAFGPSADELNKRLADVLDLPDWGLRVRTRRDERAGNKIPSRELPYVSLESDRLLLEPAVVAAAEETAKALNLSAVRTLSYLANDISAHGKGIPYSIVAAVEPSASAPLGPFAPRLADDEILLADWSASPIRDVKTGDTITLKFFAPDIETGEREQTISFKLAGKIPLTGVAADPNLTPPFPGITDRLTIGEWKPPFTFDRTRIKTNDENERYWQDYRTTPKAYITRAAGERLFGSRFGTVTSLRIAPAQGETPDQTATRFAAELRRRLSPASGGIVVEPVRERLVNASRGGTDFGGLFLGFSFFLIISALLLVALMFRLNIERRAKEIGTLLATGFTPKTVRNLLLREGMVLSLIGTIIGIVIAVYYSRWLLAIIANLWPDKSAQAILYPHATPLSAILGFVLTIGMTQLAIWLAVRKLIRIPPPLLLRGQTQVPELLFEVPSRRPIFLAITCLVVAIGALVGGGSLPNPDFRAMSFFMGGGLIFVAGLVFIRRWLNTTRQLPGGAGTSTVFAVGPRNAGRFPGRSLLTIVLIGAATFLLIAVESFRRRPGADFDAVTGGSGGFNLVAETDSPVFHSLDEQAGRDDVLVGLEEPYQNLVEKNPTGPTKAERLAVARTALQHVKAAIPLRLRGGDDASCLNLYQAGKPRLLGVPNALLDRGGFQFAMTEATTVEELANPWLLLKKELPDGVIPIFAEQNTVMWMLKTTIGGTIEVQDDAGTAVKCRIVGTLLDNVFQSELLMSDAVFRKLYPRDEGFRVFLVQTEKQHEAEVARLLSTGLANVGMSVTPSRERVSRYQAVIGTYLTTFQLLGGLGLLLGILGLAIVILRNVWERISELALLRAFGYPPHAIRILVLGENLFLLAIGVGLGVVAAIISVLPHLALGGRVPWLGIVTLIALVLVVGVAVVTLATRNAVRIPLLNALRKD